MTSLAYASQNGHVENRIVRYTGCVASDGFLLARSGPIAEAKFYALYNDGTAEEINPPGGKPRPTPDPAVRTKTVSVPGSLRGVDVPAYASQFTGQMRQVVQCEFSRGADTKFSYTFARTHGLLEYPAHVSGSDKASEAATRARAKYFVIEISAEGVFAAPVKFGVDCCSAAIVQQYMASRDDMENGAPPGANVRLNLAWYHASKQGGRNAPVQQVLSAEQVGAVLTKAGGPWYPQMGWAFSYSGDRAANVLNKVTYANGYAYQVSLVRISLKVELAAQVGATIYRSGDVAIVSASGHDVIEGAVASIQGANEADYNGAHVAFDVTASGFKYRLPSAAIPSPATGAIQIASLANGATVSASIAIADTGRVAFKFGNNGTLWCPLAPTIWQGVYPSPDRAQYDGPVHVFYDGEEEIMTRWFSRSTSVPREHNFDPDAGVNWQGGLSGTHMKAGERVDIHICQHGSCTHGGDTPILSGSGSFTSAHTQEIFGFAGPVDGSVEAYTRQHGEAHSAPIEEFELPVLLYGNFYGLCPDCFQVDENGKPITAHAASIELRQWKARIQNDIIEVSESSGGGSTAIMLWHEREGIVIFRAERRTRNGEQKALYGTTWVREASRATDDSAARGLYTDYEIPMFKGGWFAGQEARPPIDEDSSEGQLHARASGSFLQSRSLSFNPDTKEISNRTVVEFYFTQQHQIATSPLWVMRGAMYYPDPTLAPADQKGNIVYYLDDEEKTVLAGGFVNPDHTIVAFVGKA